MGIETMADSSRARGVRKSPPGPKGNFLLGSTFAYLRDPMGFVAQAKRDHGDVVWLRLGNLRTYLVSHPEHIEYVLRTHADNFMKDKLTRWLIPLVGEGLLTSEGTLWRRQRRLAQPAFQHQQIERYAAVMVEHTERMLRTWQDGEVRDPHEELMQLTLGIVAKTLFDAELSENAKTVGHSLEVVMNHFMSPMRWFRFLDYLPIPSSRRYWRAIDRLDRIIYGIIKSHRDEGRDRGDLLSRLLAARDEEGAGMTDRQLRDEVVTLVLAGHETTALVLFYAFYLLSQSPESEARLADELHAVVPDRSPTAADVPNLKYAEWVVREAMRLYPPAWGIAREALADCEIGGYHVPKGTQVFMTQWLVHRDARWFDDPEVFRPERWDNDLIRRLPRCAYFPFGDGPRICIGNHFAMMEAVLILATIVRRYRLVVEPGQTLELLPSITLRPKHSLGMRLHGRAVGGTRRRSLDETPAEASPSVPVDSR
ncbi:MAG: cytochrome P450 [Isosphaeraceae bacterium]